ncbi:MAG: hypothetical protein HOQ19_01855 [Gemmatimonadaceae bacterium]|nr:hypothetical protein [Gemmatimonadaceae bacterium]NUP54550.1 hypothetical protein [Gemmatimonadaceae bacterium]
MILALQVAVAALLLAPADTTVAVRDSADAGPRVIDARLGPTAADDTTPHRRPRAVEVSDAYALRLRIHHYASYAMIPLFTAQAIAGNQMYQSGSDDPAWAKSLHGIGAAGLGALFTVNTVTGVWNLWESRGVSEGRTARLVHSVFMLASDAGFAYAGIKLGPDAHNSFSKRQEHRRVAYISMGSALAGYATMLVANR